MSAFELFISGFGHDEGNINSEYSPMRIQNSNNSLTDYCKRECRILNNFFLYHLDHVKQADSSISVKTLVMNPLQQRGEESYNFLR